MTVVTTEANVSRETIVTGGTNYLNGGYAVLDGQMDLFESWPCCACCELPHRGVTEDEHPNPCRDHQQPTP